MLLHGEDTTHTHTLYTSPSPPPPPQYNIQHALACLVSSTHTDTHTHTLQAEKGHRLKQMLLTIMWCPLAKYSLQCFCRLIFNQSTVSQPSHTSLTNKPLCAPCLLTFHWIKQCILGTLFGPGLEFYGVEQIKGKFLDRLWTSCCYFKIDVICFASDGSAHAYVQTNKLPPTAQVYVLANVLIRNFGVCNSSMVVGMNRSMPCDWLLPHCVYHTIVCLSGP